MKPFQVFLLGLATLASIAVFGTLFWSWDDGSDVCAVDVIKQVVAGGLVAGASAGVATVLYTMYTWSKSDGLLISSLLFAMPGAIFGFQAGALYERHELEVARDGQLGIGRAGSGPSSSPATTSR